MKTAELTLSTYLQDHAHRFKRRTGVIDTETAAELELPVR